MQSSVVICVVETAIATFAKAWSHLAKSIQTPTAEVQNTVEVVLNETWCDVAVTCEYRETWTF